MHYDFERRIDRTDSGSVKYALMRAADPEVPAGVVPLSIGDMELATPPKLVDGLKEYLENTVLGYTAATPADRRATTDWMRTRHSWAVEPEWIVGCDGVVPSLYLAVSTLTEPGDGVLYMPPVYRPMYNAIHDTGRTPVAAPLLLQDGVYRMDFELMERQAATGSVRMALLCSPHNPVSRVWREDELQRLAELCLRHDILLVSDDIHMDFVMPGHRHRVVAELCPSLAERCIICTAPSKTFNIAGLQTSNIIIPGRDLRKRYKTAYLKTGRHEVNQLGLAACRIAYERCAGWLDAVLELIRGNGEVVRAFMATHFPEVTVSPHEGTYFLWLDFRPWGLEAPELEQFMVKARLFLDEGHIFGEGGAGFERINLACPRSVLQEALERLRVARVSGN